MNILLSANDDFLNHIDSLIFSIVRNNKNEPINIYLLYFNLNENKLNNLKNNLKTKYEVTLFGIKLNEENFKNLPVTNKDKSAYFGPEAYLRIFAQFILPHDLDRILYLDIDIICDGNLNSLYNMDFQNYEYVACEDLNASIIDKKRIHINKEEKYLNSGVLLINLKKLRSSCSEEILMKFIHENKDILVYPDQDILNMFYEGKIRFVSGIYNYTQFKNQSKEAHPILFHYIGVAKPWNTKEVGKVKFRFYIKYLKYQFLKEYNFKVTKMFLFYIVKRIKYLFLKLIKK